MLNLHEVEAAIRELENGSATYNNCMKLASLYIVRDELRQKESRYGNYNYNYYPMYEHMGNNGNNGSSSYGYKEPMYYNNEDLIIKKDMMGDYPKRG